VKWTNNGFNFHTVTSDGGAGPLDSATLGHLGTYSFTFSTGGSYAYHCSIHAFMHGSVTVGAIPEFSSSILVVVGLLGIMIGTIFLRKRR